MEEKIAIIDTNGQQSTVVLSHRTALGLEVWARSRAGATEPAQHVLPMLDDLLVQRQVERTALCAVAFGQGPGGFTGLRVACGLAQGLAFALDIPVIPIPSLLAVAAQDQAQTPAQTPCAWVVLQDARMGEVYAAVYALKQRWQTLHPPCLIGVGTVAEWLAASRSRWVDAHGTPLALRAVGDALCVHPALAASAAFDSVGTSAPVDAHTLARLAQQAWDDGQTLPPELAAPLYVRDKIAYTTRERTQGLGGNPKADGVALPAAAPVIAPMTPAHLAQVVDIERSVQSFPWTEGNFHDALQSGYGAWVALDHGKVQGFCVVMFAPDVAHLLVLAVARDSQRRGLGRWLVHHAQQQARRRQLAALLLEVRPSNQSARAFYQALGFVPLSTRKDYYPAGQGRREDALVLRKSLAPQAAQQTSVRAA